MRTFRLDKLVKDEVFEDMISSGQEVKHRILDDDEFAKCIRSKIVEEALEFQVAGDERELQDLLGAITAVEPSKVVDIVYDGEKVRNCFLKKIYVETVTISDQDPWLEYYLNNPDRYHESSNNGFQND